MTPIDGIMAADIAIVAVVGVALIWTLAGMVFAFRKESWSSKTHLLAGFCLLFSYTIITSICNGIRRVLWVNTGKMWWFIDSWGYVGVKSLALLAAVMVLCGLVMDRWGRHAYFWVWGTVIIVLIAALLSGNAWR